LKSGVATPDEGLLVNAAGSIKRVLIDKVGWLVVKRMS
jgi:hypothetical protein